MLAHDRSLIKARGEVWHKRDRQKGITSKKPFDQEAQWRYSETKGWAYGYGIHLTCIATPENPVFPVLAELTTANHKGINILEDNFEKLPEKTEHILADKEYDVQRIYYKSKHKLLTPVRETRNRKTKSKKGQKLYRLRNSSLEQLFNVSKNIFKIEPSWFFSKAYTEVLALMTIYIYRCLCSLQ